MEKYAYIRVSTKEQSIDRQLLALEPYQIKKKNIYCDYQSGKDFDRPAYQRMIKKLKPGDLLIVKSIDRLGRNYNDILVQWQYITKEIKADILVLDIFAYVAQTEREFIKQRQAEGIAAAKRNGKRFGRPEKKMPDQFKEICQRCKRGEVSTRQAADILKISHSTFYRRYRKEVEENVSNSRRFGTSE